ncbi:hypothetical protein A9Q98_03390 [Thalassotalea sp. 42_200_T64]|nr:hypothetical protein A9Q98_03390 [Thalassotalea sp. 42_200_T64]
MLFILVIFILGCDGESSSNNQDKVTGVCSNQAIPFEQTIFLKNGYHIYLIGDTGTGDSNQVFSAEILEKYHLQYPLDAIIHSGDIFYPAGINSASDANVEEKFNGIYDSLALDNIPWYLVAGNHDHEGSIAALQDFAAQSPLLNYPSRYFLHQLHKNGLSWQLNLIAIDTTPFTHNANQLEQLSWLEQQLAQNSQNINIVVGHHPVFSNGSHGDTSPLKASFLDLLRFYQVPLYLSGHEHSLEILQNKAGPTYVISGAGGQTLRDIECAESSLYAAQEFGGIALFITSTSIGLIPVTQTSLVMMFQLPLR